MPLKPIPAIVTPDEAGTILRLTPAQLRAVADVLDAEGAREVREIADRLERDGEYSVVRPATRVTYRLP